MMDENELVIRAGKGDEDAWRELFDRNFSKLYRLARFISKNDEDAKEICQLAFTQAFKGTGKLRKPESFGLWIYKIARNYAYLHVKKKRLRSEISLDYSIDSFLTAYDDSEEERVKQREMEIIKEIIETIPADAFKETVKMFYVEGANTGQIADKQGIPISTVTTRLNRFRGRYRREIIRRILALREADHG